jgi:hypothetical protein
MFWKGNHMAKKCFIASVEIDILVFAEDEDEARDIAGQHLADEAVNISDDDFSVRPATYYPPGWEPHCIVYQSGDAGEDVTAKEALEATPEFVEARKRFADMAVAKTPKA